MPRSTDRHTFRIILKSDRTSEGRQKDFGVIEATYPDLTYEQLTQLQNVTINAINKAYTEIGMKMAEELTRSRNEY